MKKCSLCSKSVQGDLDSTVITPVQARALSTVLTFDTAEVSGGIESKYVHTTPCSLCHQWIIDAEVIISEWEQTIDKIRTIGCTLKKVIQGFNLGQLRTREEPLKSQVDETDDSPLSYLRLQYDNKHALQPINCKIKSEADDDPDWVPDDDRGIEDLETPSLCHKNYNSYTVNINGDTVALKHCQIGLLPCDHPTFKYPRSSRKIRDSRSSSRSLKNRKKRRRRQRTSALLEKVKRRKVGRPSKWLEPPGESRNCFKPGCYFRSADSDRLAGHYREVHLNDPHPYKCLEPECGKKYSEFRRFLVHRGVHRGLYPFTCEHCLKGFTRRDILADHVIHKHTENPKLLECDLCRRKFRLAKNLRSHVRIFHSDKTFRCTVEGCEFITKSPSSLRSHRARQHPEQFPELRSTSEQMCAECGATFQSKSVFERHLLVHSGAPIETLKPFKCLHVDCKFRATHKSHVENHVKMVHETTGKTVVCTVPGCTTKLKTIANLAVHLRKTHAPKPDPADRLSFPCDKCGLKLHSNCSLQRHSQLKHTEGNQRDYVCPQCQKGFPVKRYLDRHRLKYPNCKPLQVGPNSAFCEMCDKHCSNAAGLKRHQLLVHNTGDKPWKCEPCGKVFPIKMYLTRHQMSSKSCASVSVLPAAPASKQQENEKVMKSTKKSVTTPSAEPAPEKAVGTVNPLQFLSLAPQSQMEQDFYYAFYGYQYQATDTADTGGGE